MKLVKGKYCEYWTNYTGQLHDEYKWWHKNGQQHVHCFYDHGELHGESKYWQHNDGQMSEHYFYEHGNIVRDLLTEPFTSEEDKFEFSLIHDGRWL